VQEFFYDAAAKTMALQITRYYDVPKHGAAVAIGTGTPEAHQPFASPDADHCITAHQQSPQLRKAATPGPKRMAIKQALQLEQAAAGA
jgi:hypothetical protein